MADRPIGIFDSGFGGLTVARSVIDQLPHESILYVGDTARQPYGPKPIGEVREYALECLDHLVDQDVKALVIACNSASAAMLRDARERYDVPVVEVIYPATRRAVAATRNGRIGVICTRATADSMAYDDAFAAAPQVTLTTRACPQVRGLRGARGHRRRRADRGGTRVPRPAARRRRRHADPRLHALPAAHRRHLLGDGRRRHAGQQCGGVREGRLQAAARPRPAAARRASRSTASSPPAAPRTSPRSGSGSSDRSCTSPTSSWGDSREGHRDRLRRVLPRAGLAGELLPRGGRLR